jgi:uncharacterized iron-regulated membrane protein
MHMANLLLLLLLVGKSMRWVQVWGQQAQEQGQGSSWALRGSVVTLDIPVSAWMGATSR